MSVLSPASALRRYLLLHRQSEAGVRATVVSLNSWISQPSFAIGAIVLAALAERTSVSTAMLVSAVILALAAPLYIPAWRQSRMDSAARVEEPEPEPVHSA